MEKKNDSTNMKKIYIFCLYLKGGFTKNFYMLSKNQSNYYKKIGLLIQVSRKGLVLKIRRFENMNHFVTSLEIPLIFTLLI